MEARDTYFPALQAIVVPAQFRAGAHFGLQVRITYVNLCALSGDARDAAVELIQLGRLVAPAYAALQRPLFRGVPHQIAAGADVATKGGMVVVAGAQREGQRSEEGRV